MKWNLEKTDIYVVIMQPPAWTSICFFFFLFFLNWHLEKLFFTTYPLLFRCHYQSGLFCSPLGWDRFFLQLKLFFVDRKKDYILTFVRKLSKTTHKEWIFLMNIDAHDVWHLGLTHLWPCLSSCSKLQRIVESGDNNFLLGENWLFTVGCVN